MTTERLDRIEALLLQLSEATVRHDNQLSRLEQLVESNTQAIAIQRQAHDELIRDAVEWFGDFAERFDRDHQAILQMQTDVREMQSEVRGLQTESRRILERLDRGNS